MAIWMHAHGLHTEIHAVYSSQFKSWSYQLLISSSNYPSFMVPTNSIPCLWQFAHDPQYEPHQSNPPSHTQTTFHKHPSHSSLPEVIYFSWGVPATTWSPYVLRALPIFPTVILVKRCNYEAPLYVMFAIPLSTLLKHSWSILMYVPCTVHNLLFRPTNTT